MTKFVLIAGASGVALLTAGFAVAADGDYPANPVPGHCYARVVTPVQYEVYQEQVLVTPEKTEIRTIPAEYRWEEQKYVVKQEAVEFITVPGTYKTITETIVVKEPTTRTEVVAAVYETVTEQVLVREAHTEWKPGNGLDAYAPGYGAGKPGYSPAPGAGGYGAGGSGAPAGYGVPVQTKVTPTGEVLCLVEVPAEYKTVTKQVLKTPAHTVTIQVPGETQTVTKQVVDQEARVEKRIIPAVYGYQKVRVLVSPERTETYTIPAVYKTIDKTRVVGGGKLEWREIICEKDMNGPLPANAIPCQPGLGGATCKPPGYHEHEERREEHHPKGYGERGAVKVSTPTSLAKAQPAPVKAVPAAAKPAAVQTASLPSASQAAATQHSNGVSMVARMQEALAVKGYYKGAVDGFFTEASREALVRFQRDNHVAEGQLTVETARLLGIWN